MEILFVFQKNKMPAKLLTFFCKASLRGVAEDWHTIIKCVSFSFEDGEPLPNLRSLFTGGVQYVPFCVAK